MEKATALTIIFTPTPQEKHSDIYVYDEEHFIEKADGSSGIGYLKAKYAIEDEFTWHFLNAGKLQEFLDKELSEYYGKVSIDTLSGYIVRSLNYRHTGLSIRYFEKGMVYIGKDGSTYICLAGTAVYDSKWLQTEALRKYRTNSCSHWNFQIPKGTAFDVMDWFQVKTEIVNVSGRAILGRYRIEENKAVFI